MKRLLFKITTLLLLVTILFQVSNFTCLAAKAYQEYDVDSKDKIKKSLTIEWGRTRMSYNSQNKLQLTYKNYEGRKIDQFTYNTKSKKEEKIYKGNQICMANSVAAYGDLRYLYSQNKKKKAVTITVYNKDMKKQYESSFAMKGLLTTKEIKQLKKEDVWCRGLEAIDKNKVQMLYSIYLGSGKCSGGVAVLDLKTKKVNKKTNVDFSPLKCDDKYIYGNQDSKKDIYCIAKRKNGKILKTYKTDYGMDESDKNLVSGISYDKSTFCSDYKDGQIIIVNYSGVYYGSVNSTGLEKILDINELPYYVENYQKKDFLRIALKDKKEFSILYCDGNDGQGWVIKKYK